MGRWDSDEDDWRGWKNGKYDSRYSNNRRRKTGKNPYRRKQGKKIAIGISVILVVGLVGFLFTNGIFEINQEKLDKSIQNIPQSIEEAGKTTEDLASETSMMLGDAINQQFEEIQLKSDDNQVDDIIDEQNTLEIEKAKENLPESIREVVQSREWNREYRGLPPLTLDEIRQIESSEIRKAEEQIEKEEERELAAEKYLQDITLKIHELINEERTLHGMTSLAWEPKLAQAAENHSMDMATRDYFEHDSPEGYDFTWRYSQVGFSCLISATGNQFSLGGENIMWMEGYSGVETIASATVTGWMNSPGHRSNILTSYFQSEGIGIAKSGNEVYVTQNFC